MSGKRTLGTGLAALGVVLLLAGLAMPATRTETARACYDSTVQYGQNCVETTYQAPTAKGPVLGSGFASMVAGAILRYVGRDAELSADATNATEREAPLAGAPNRTGADRGGRGDVETLAEQVARHGSEDESTGEARRPNTRKTATPTADATETTTAVDESQPSVPSSLGVAGRSAAVAVVGGLVASSAVGLLVGTASTGVAWLVYTATGLGAVALWRRRATEPTSTDSPKTDQ